MFTGPIYICLYNFVKTETLSLNSVGDKSTFEGDDKISWIISTCKKCNKLKANNWYNFELTNYHLYLIQPNCRTATKPLFVFYQETHLPLKTLKGFTNVLGQKFKRNLPFLTYRNFRHFYYVKGVFSLSWLNGRLVTCSLVKYGLKALSRDLDDCYKEHLHVAKTFFRFLDIQSSRKRLWIIWKGEGLNIVGFQLSAGTWKIGKTFGSDNHSFVCFGSVLVSLKTCFFSQMIKASISFSPL